MDYTKLKEDMSIALRNIGSIDFSKIISDSIVSASKITNDPKKWQSIYHNKISENIKNWGEFLK